MTYHSLVNMIVGLAISSSGPSSARVLPPWCVGLGYSFTPFISQVPLGII
jgi:hypothetical protein